MGSANGARSPDSRANHDDDRAELRMTESLWTKHDVAAFLGVTVRTVESMAIPRVRMPATGRKPIVRFDPDEVRAWVESFRTRPKRAKKAG